MKKYREEKRGKGDAEQGGKYRADICQLGENYGADWDEMGEISIREMRYCCCRSCHDQKTTDDITTFKIQRDS